MDIYSYCLYDPINRTDPEGLQISKVFEKLFSKVVSWLINKVKKYPAGKFTETIADRMGLDSRLEISAEGEEMATDTDGDGIKDFFDDDDDDDGIPDIADPDKKERNDDFIPPCE